MSALTMASLRFPILRLNDSHIRRFRSLPELRRMTQRYFDRGDYKQGAFLIDSLGRRFPIQSVRKVGRSWHPAFWFAPSPAILVEIELGEPAQLTLDEIKALIVDRVCRKHWYRQGGETEGEFRTSFDRLESVSEVMANVSFYGVWQG